MPSESEPPLHIFERNHLRLKFNIENICRKYEKIKESGVEVDLEEEAFYTDKTTQRPLANKARQLYYAVGENWGLCPISAPFNSIENLEGNNSLKQKCSKRDEEFNGDILAVTPYEPPTHFTAKRKFREIINEETYTAEGSSVAELEDFIQKNGITGKIVYRAVENNVAVIKIRHSTRSVVDETTETTFDGENDNDEVAREFANVKRKSLLGTQASSSSTQMLAIEAPPTAIERNSEVTTLPEDDPLDEVAREFANVKRKSLREIQAPSSSTLILAIEAPPTATENKSEVGTLPEDDALDEVAREFANARRESLGLPPVQPISQSTASSSVAENVDNEDKPPGIQTPTAPKHITPSRKRGSASLEVSPKSKRSSQRSITKINEVDDEFRKVHEANSDEIGNPWYRQTGSSMHDSYITASNKLRTLFGVNKNDIDECEPSDILIEFWVNSTVFWKEKFPGLFTCEFFKHEERRQFSAARARNHNLQSGFA